MAELADGFLALPGGIGTFEELFEVMTWSQLGIHSKPIALVNVSGFFDPLLALLDHAIAEGFVRAQHRLVLVASEGPQSALEQMLTMASSAKIQRSSLEI